MSSETDMDTIKAISFDLDDTLWECDPVIQRAEKSLMDYLSARCAMVRDRYTLESFNKTKIDFMRANKHLVGDVTRMRKALLKDLLADCQVHQPLVDEAFEHFYHVRSQVELFEDSLPALQFLQQHYHLASLTNGNADLKKIGIDHLFGEMHFATLECPAKPEPDMFHRTCEAFGIQHHELLHVGDNPVTDVEGARNAGARTVWINRFNQEWPQDYLPADVEIQCLSELVSLLQKEVDLG